MGIPVRPQEEDDDMDYPSPPSLIDSSEEEIEGNSYCEDEEDDEEPTEQQTSASAAQGNDSNEGAKPSGLHQKYRRLLAHDTEWQRFMGVVKGADDWESDKESADDDEWAEIDWADESEHQELMAWVLTHPGEAVAMLKEENTKEGNEVS